MKKAWALTNNKALINFSQNYCDTEISVLDSEGFRSVLEHYFNNAKKRKSSLYYFIVELVKEDDLDLIIKEITTVFKLLLIMDSKQIANNFDEYKNLFEKKHQFRKFIEEVYTFWRNLERYAIIHVNQSTTGLFGTTFIQSKEQFDSLIINLYRTISNNSTMDKPTVYRQVPAGTNAAMVVYDAIWPIPKGYEILKDIPFIEEIVLQSPFITYPSGNTRNGYFKELKINPLKRCKINPENFFCYPAKVGELLAYVFVERDFLTHGVSLANLFELPSIEEISGKKPELLVIFGAKDNRNELVSGYLDDKENDLLVGYVSADKRHDYFGYMKKIILTLNNLYNIKQGKLPIHGAMVKIVLNNGDKANVVIVGDSGVGKSESIEALRSLKANNISEMTIIFDDMGTFAKEDNKIKAYGTEIGAFVRLDDLEEGYAFKELDRSIFMNPDKINSRLITPVSNYQDIIQGLPIDILLYANNYSELKPNKEAIKFFDDLETAKSVFIEGKRMSKGTTTETGMTTSFFANPFGPYQMESETRKIIDDIFQQLASDGTKMGVLNTQLGVSGMEKKGPKQAAIDLLFQIKKLNEKKEVI